MTIQPRRCLRVFGGGRCKGIAKVPPGLCIKHSHIRCHNYNCVKLAVHEINDMLLCSECAEKETKREDDSK